MAEAVVWREFRGTAAELHALPMPTDEEPTAAGSAELWVMRPSGRSLVMGSAQKPERFDRAALSRDGVDLAPRRSGGGAVFIEPAATVWIDLVAPRSSRLYSLELIETFMIVGRLWQQALRSLGLETDLVETSAERTDAAALACWAGLGWGELTVIGSRGRPAKIVGLSQRRTRWGARVQAMAVLDESSAQVSAYLPEADAALVRSAIPTTALDLRVVEVEAAVRRAFGA